MTKEFRVRVFLGQEFENTNDVFPFGSRSMVRANWFDDTYNAEDLKKVVGSDWDYAVEYSEPMQRELSDKGWRRVENRGMYYEDDCTVAIYEKIVDGETIQLSLKSHIRPFRDAWLSINKEFYWKYINKKSPQALPREDVATYISQLFHLANGHYTPQPVDRPIRHVEARIVAFDEIVEAPRIQPGMMIRAAEPVQDVAVGA